MAKVKVKVTGAFVDGNAPDSTVSIEEDSAKYLESIGYVEVQKETKSEEKPKSKSKSKSK